MAEQNWRVARRASILSGLALAFGAVSAGAQQPPNTLATIKARGIMACGVHTGIAGFAQPDDKGNWTGFDVDLCRAVATTVLGDPAKVRFVPTTPKERFTALQSGEIDVLIRGTTWTSSRDISLGLVFTGITFYDGQGFMVKKALGVKSAKELAGASICVQTGTTTELNLADYFKTNGMQFKPVVFEKADEVLTAFEAGRCDVYTNDSSALAAQRIQLSRPDDNMVLPEIISKEPLGPSVRQGDFQWFTIVKWVHYARLVAEELGVTQANVEASKASANGEIKRLLGVEGEFGKPLGLDNDWAAKVILAVGNYGEAFDKHLGGASRINIPRGVNRLWSQGGLQYAPPIR